MRVNLMSLLAALAMISPAALAQSGSGADDQTAAPTQAETDVERSDSGPGGQGDTSEGTPQGGSLAEMDRSEEHTSELQSLMRISYAVLCLKKKKTKHMYTD